MDSNASNNIYFKPSYRTTQQGEQRGLSSVKQSLRELPQPNSNPKFSCGLVINGEAMEQLHQIRAPGVQRQWKMKGSAQAQAAGEQEFPWLSPAGCTTACPCCL